MHVSLALVGAHDGSKLKRLITDANKLGSVLLVEPVPFLYQRLKSSFGSIETVLIENACISTSCGKVQFTAPRPTANSVAPHGDQLGSLLPDHATNHDKRFLEHVEIIEVESMTFTSVLDKHKIDAIDILFCDTEGMDATILDTYPFERVLPRQLIFEYKHSDGTNNIGARLGQLLIKLSGLGYRIAILDGENMFAEQKEGAAPKCDYRVLSRGDASMVSRIARFCRRAIRRVAG